MLSCATAGFWWVQQEIQTAGEELKERDKQLDQSRKEVWLRMYILGTQTYFLDLLYNKSLLD